jgi:hypothetical protein
MCISIYEGAEAIVFFRADCVPQTELNGGIFDLDTYKTDIQSTRIVVL